MLAAYQILQQQAKILRLGNNELHIVDAGVFEHLRQRNVLAQGALEVEPVALRGDELYAPVALLQYLKKAFGIVDVFDLHRFHSFLFATPNQSEPELMPRGSDPSIIGLINHP